MNLEKKGTSFSDKETFEADIFFKAVDLACEALIACASKIDNIDKFSGVCHYDRCGSKLANIAKIIKTKILNERIFVSPLSSIIFQIALIFEKNIHDPQAKLYSIFFNSFGKAIQKQENVQVNWIDAFVVAIDSIEKIAKDTKFFNILSSVKEAFYSAYAEENNFTIIHALNQAVTTAQNKTSHVILDTQKMSKDMFNIEDYEFSELAEAHAIGIWLRGAFEGFKLKYINKIPPNKYSNVTNYDLGDIIII